MTTFVLKIIACVCMLIDHLTCILMPNGTTIDYINISAATQTQINNAVIYTVGRGIGRLAFPIFCFLLVEGFKHTSNLKKYMLRIAIFAFISEFPFDLAFFGFGDAKFLTHQNVMFTLFIGLLAVSIIDRMQKVYFNDYLKYNIFSCAAIIGGCVAAMLLNTDYSVYGVVLPVIFYVFRNKKLWITLVMAVCIYLFLISDGSSIINFAELLALPLIFSYNGKKGPSLKYGFYAFYPVHLLLLGLIF